MLFSFAIKNLKFPDGEALCVTWVEYYTMSTALIYSTAIFLAVMNIVLKSVLSFLSRFERSHTKTELIASSTIKMFILQFINTVLFIDINHVGYHHFVSQCLYPSDVRPRPSAFKLPNLHRTVF